MQAGAPEGDDEGALGPNEHEDQEPVENPELLGKPPCSRKENQDTRDEEGRSVSSRGLSQVELDDRREERKPKLELARLQSEKE
ncbi:hypothetical protein NDU88_009822 [Pleurodeles waltl]|uniref:Uncharacterized protein n=1 Tax=Pleurodeles waltl TaxID=8319 RepID=A0AAV7RXC3_PLEWA|nr:hypothetical protein NDU88_009822 [Pleurodeles waltl]